MSSADPVCSKCGLPYGEVGIQELAALDRRNEAALEDAQTLAAAATVPFLFLALSFVIGAVLPEAIVSYGFIALVGSGLFWWKFFAWSRSYAQNEFPDESFEQARRIRNRSAVVATIGLLALAVMVYEKLV